jgi:hypothetical protein
MCIKIFLNFVLHPIYSALVDFGTYDQWDDSFHHFFEVEQRQRVQVTKPPHNDVAIRHEDGEVIKSKYVSCDENERGELENMKVI